MKLPAKLWTSLLLLGLCGSLTACQKEETESSSSSSPDTSASVSTNATAEEVKSQYISDLQNNLKQMESIHTPVVHAATDEDTVAAFRELATLARAMGDLTPPSEVESLHTDYVVVAYALADYYEETAFIISQVLNGTLEETKAISLAEDLAVNLAFTVDPEQDIIGEIKSILGIS